MSFAKYFEDNMEIIEERFALRQQENDHTPVYRVSHDVASKIYLVTTKVVEVKADAPKKHKRKKKKNRMLRLRRNLPLYGRRTKIL